MTDIMSKEKRSAVMSRIRSKNTTPEKKLRKLLRTAGYLDYRVKNTLPGTPDLIFRKAKLAVFVHGCFWHGCDKCYRTPRTNSPFWRNKLHINKTRDKRAAKELREKGWMVLTLWEHELRSNPNKSLGRIIRALKKAVEG